VDWQQITALAIVAAAFLWLVRRAFISGGKGGCGTCGGCAPAPRPERQASLIQLDPPCE
jgi:hypothetical protein